MGYLFLVISLLAGNAKGYFGKRLSAGTTDLGKSVCVNLMRMLVCIVIGIAVLGVSAHHTDLVIDFPAIWIGIISGIMLSFFVVTWLFCARNGAYMLISVAMMLGAMVTIGLSCMVFRENVSGKQCLGIMILICAVLIMYSYNTGIKGKMGPKAVFILVACGVSNGLYDFTQKIFVNCSASSISVLNVITYIVSACILFFCLQTKSMRMEKEEVPSFVRATVVSVVIMAVCLFLNTYFKAAAAKYLTATQLYPVYEGGGLILSTLMSGFLFKERITGRCIAGVILAFLSLLLLK